MNWLRGVEDDALVAVGDDQDLADHVDPADHGVADRLAQLCCRDTSWNDQILANPRCPRTGPRPARRSPGRSIPAGRRPQVRRGLEGEVVGRPLAESLGLAITVQEPQPDRLRSFTGRAEKSVISAADIGFHASTSYFASMTGLNEPRQHPQDADPHVTRRAGRRAGLFTGEAEQVVALVVAQPALGQPGEHRRDGVDRDPARAGCSSRSTWWPGSRPPPGAARASAVRPRGRHRRASTPPAVPVRTPRAVPDP